MKQGEKSRSRLAYDTFEVHMTENVKAVFTKENLARVPDKLTSVLQPLEFFDLRKSWMEWMADGIQNLIYRISSPIYISRSRL